MRHSKPWMIPVALAALGLALAGCGASDTGSGATASAGPAKPYPLEVCLVSDEKLGSMGDPVVLVHEGQEVKFCCDSCTPKFKKDPAKYLAKLKEK